MEQGKTRAHPFRFRKSSRLVNSAAFARVFDKAGRSRDKWFTVLCRPNGAAQARLGLAISKKHCRRATTRNTIKRIVRESFRNNKAALEGFDLVVINQPSAATATRQQLFDSLARHWRRCGTAVEADAQE